MTFLVDESFIVRTWWVNALFPVWLVRLSLVSLQPWKNFLIFLNGQYVVSNIVGLFIYGRVKLNVSFKYIILRCFD